MEKLTSKNASDLKAEPRNTIGKGPARQLRKNGLIPAVFYGSRAVPMRITISPDELYEALNTPKLKNTLIELKSEHEALNGRLVMVKEIQRHPLTREFLHVDLIEVYSDVEIKSEIPINLVGHPKGVELGGTLEQSMRMIAIKCAPEKIPADVEIDVSDLGIGDSVKLEEVKLDEGVEILDDLQNTIALVVAPRVLEPLPGEEEEGEEGEEGAEGEDGEEGSEDGGDSGDSSE